MSPVSYMFSCADYLKPSCTNSKSLWTDQEIHNDADIYYFLIFPLSFVALYFGGDAELTVVIAILIQAIVVFVRMYLIKEMIGMRYIEFTKEVLWPIIKVTFISSLLPLIVYENFPPSKEKDIILLFMTIVCPLLSSYCFGMTSSEKDYVQKIFGRVVCSFFKK